MKKTRTLALILAALLTLSSLVSCSNTETNGDTTTEANSATETAASAEDTTAETETEKTQIDDGLGNPDFGGYTFRIVSCMFGGDYGANRVMYSELTGNPVSDALYESMMYIEDRFNVKYESIEIYDGADVGAAITECVSAGDDAYDISINHDRTTIGNVKTGCYRNLMSVEQFDFERPWWPDTVESLSIGNRLFAASNYLSYLGLHWTRGVIINKDYAESIDMEIPYDLVREGKWTTDALLERTSGVSQDLDGNGEYTTDDKLAFVTGTQTSYCMQESQDIPIYRHDSDGNLYLDIDQEKIDTFVQKWRSLIQSNDFYKNDNAETVFAEGHALFNYADIGNAYDNYRNTDIRYGFLPTPKFDEYQENYINCCTDLLWGIPQTVSTGEQLDTVGTLCEAISCYNYQNVLPVYFEAAMKARAADSADDAEMLQLIADTRTIAFSFTYNLQMNNILSDLGSSNKEVASYIKGQSKVTSKMLDNLLTTMATIDD